MARKKAVIIQFKAQVWQVKTLVDGGMNVTLALSDKEIAQVSQLLKCKNEGFLLEVAAVPVKQETENAKKTSNKKSTGSRRKQRYPYRT